MAPRMVTPKQDRSVAMRARILQATLDCLARLGYAGTTTTAVERHAHISRGALLYHFPTRAVLVSAAVERLFAELREQYETAFAALTPRANRLGAAIDLLWRAFQDPRLAAVLELYVAARTDTELHTQLKPVADEHQRNVRRLALNYFPEAAAKPGFTALIDLALDAMQGMAVRALSKPHDPALKRSLALLKQLAAAAAEEP